MKIVRTPAQLASETSLTSTVLQLDAALKLGYTSAMLILERWELAQMPPEALYRSDEENPSSTSKADILTQSIINCALTVLSTVGSLTTAFGTIPTYDILLGAYAGVTLVQLADFLPDIRSASELMLQVEQQRRNSRCRDQVLHWASNMMQKKLLDLGSGSPGNVQLDAGQANDFFQWMPLGVLDAVGSDSAFT